MNARSATFLVAIDGAGLTAIILLLGLPTAFPTTSD
jgi:hypothetical protein